MPSRADDKWLGNSRKTFEALVGQYGYAKGEQVYEALLNKRKALKRRARQPR